VERVARNWNDGVYDAKHLDGGQLLKHLLGLARQDAGRPVLLVYLWFDPGGAAASSHRAEIARFRQDIAMGRDEVRFHALTVQELVARLRQSSGVDRGYAQYLHDRYSR
jgi:hypothetical protein